jgi:hypothetical protein
MMFWHRAAKETKWRLETGSRSRGWNKAYRLGGRHAKREPRGYPAP